MPGLPTIDALPDPPVRGVDAQEIFSSKTDDWHLALPGWIVSVNALIPLVVDAAAGSAPTATSTSSVAIGVGSKAYVIESGKQFVAGQYIVIADAADPLANFMWGQVESYNFDTGALVFVSQTIVGSGTKASWLIGLSGPQGEVGGGQLTSPNLVGTPVQDEFTMDDTVSVDIDPANGAIHHLTLTASRTLTHSLAPGQFALLMIDDGTGFAAIWTTMTPVWKTDGGAAPTLLTSGETPILFANMLGTLYGWRLGDA
ncbi:MAG: hypothetical protein KUG65_13200 [Sphingomonadaceae bacterium]|nr:hypothetical protein [Sphingomonadaceae bacterium]